MSKIMLVEDDNNLREIYEARLLAEGYEIVSARDGEEALALAVKEKPDLIIADVMMPKISGFDMLDILRGTPETKNVKVIVMTALSQAEDKTRADKLGADRYLVKSQVTLEDVAKVARDVLAENKSDKPKEPAAESVKPAESAKPAATPQPAPAAPMAVVEEPAGAPAPAAQEPPADQAQAAQTASAQATSTDDAGADMAAQISSFMSAKDSAAPAGPAPANDKPIEPLTEKESEQSPPTEEPKKAAGDKVIQPLAPEDSTPKPSIHELAAKEEAKETEQKAADDKPAPPHAPGTTIDPNKIAL